MQTVRSIRGQLDSSLAWLVITRMGESVGWPDFLIIYTEMQETDDFFFFGNKNGGIIVNLISGLFPTGAAIVVFLPSSSETLVH